MAHAIHIQISSPCCPRNGRLNYRRYVSTSGYSAKCARCISRPNKCVAELLSRQAQKSVYCVMSCEAVVTFILIEELFTQILVKLSNVEIYENTLIVFGMICGQVEGQKMQDVQVQSDPAFRRQKRHSTRRRISSPTDFAYV